MVTVLGYPLSSLTNQRVSASHFLATVILASHIRFLSAHKKVLTFMCK
jgi:hypothetical protein